MQDKNKWYFRKGTLIIAILSVGPLALPLVWANPRISLKIKIIITIVVIALTYFLTKAFIDSLKVLKDTIGQLNM
ncbi:MAG: hypothetical protein NT033_00905 [Candidatus Omnitrophica bacterium]|nr:hypothetical protein [Candidatus Omnitrophota bacterium]